jgi:hypothetical protein
MNAQLIPIDRRIASKPALTPSAIMNYLHWSLALGHALLGGDGGGPRSEAVGGAQRSGPPCHSVDGWAHPAEPRVLYKKA